MIIKNLFRIALRVLQIVYMLYYLLIDSAGSVVHEMKNESKTTLSLTHSLQTLLSHRGGGGGYAGCAAAHPIFCSFA